MAFEGNHKVAEKACPRARWPWGMAACRAVRLELGRKGKTSLSSFSVFLLPSQGEERNPMNLCRAHHPH